MRVFFFDAAVQGALWKFAAFSITSSRFYNMKTTFYKIKKRNPHSKSEVSIKLLSTDVLNKRNEISAVLAQKK